MDAQRDFYRLSEILGDDIYRVAHVVRSFLKSDLIIDHIVNDLENLNLDEYSDTISHILDMSVESIKEAGKCLLFADESAYIRYLHSIMDTNDLVYAPFVKRNLFD